VDATIGGNEFRYLNDYRGFAPRPNVQLRVDVIAVQPINTGDELLLNYGVAYWREGGATWYWLYINKGRTVSLSNYIKSSSGNASRSGLNFCLELFLSHLKFAGVRVFSSYSYTLISFDS
jgi:hypothetical protein